MDDRRRLLVLIAATAGAALIPLNTGMLSVALAPIISDFHVSVSVGTWLVVSYMAAMASLQPAAGKLGDIYGYRRVFLAGMVVFGLASLGAAVAPSFFLLMVFRTLQGVAGATLAPNATALIRLTYPLERQGFAMGLYVSAFSVGFTAGPVIGGVLTALFGWQAVFWANVPAVLISIWLGVWALPSTQNRQSTRLDWLGTALLTTSVTAAVLAAMLWKEDMLPVPVWAAVLTILLLGGLFYAVEKRIADPLFQMSLLGLPGFAAANAAIFFLHVMLNAVLVAIPLYLQAGRGLSPAMSGVYMVTYSLLQAIVSPLAGRLSDRLGRRYLAMIGGALYGLGFILLLDLPGDSSLLPVLAAQFLFGAGTGLATAPIQATCVAACPPSLIGVGTGVWFSTRYLGNVSGIMLTGLLLPSDPTNGAFGLFATLLGVAGLLVGSAAFLPRARVAVT